MMRLCCLGALFVGATSQTQEWILDVFAGEGGLYPEDNRLSIVDIKMYAGGSEVFCDQDSAVLDSTAGEEPNVREAKFACDDNSYTWAQNRNDGGGLHVKFILPERPTSLFIYPKYLYDATGYPSYPNRMNERMVNGNYTVSRFDSDGVLQEQYFRQVTEASNYHKFDVPNQPQALPATLTRDTPILSTPMATPSPTLATPSPTLATPSPTLATPSPTLAPTSSIGFHSDPHLTNAKGSHFNLHSSGRFTMLSISDASQTTTFDMIADLVTLDMYPCAPSYVRSVQIKDSSDNHIHIARGSNLGFENHDNETFSISFGLDKAWITHADLQHSEKHIFGNAEVLALGDTECVEGTRFDERCQRFEIHSAQVDLHVLAGASPHRSRHFLNVDVSRLNIEGMHASGLLWDDIPHDALACQ